MKTKLYQLDVNLKRFISVFVVVLSIGVLTGLAYLNQTTNYQPTKTIERFNGNQIPDTDESFDIPDTYPKPVSEMLITTHNHIIGLSLIIFLIGFIFYFNSVVSGFWKMFLMIEPLISEIITFGSIWLMRYVAEGFVYLAALSSVLLYISIFTMVVFILFELNFKKEK